MREHMEDFKKESHTQNKQNGSEHINSALDHQTTISETTSQMKVSSKIVINITRKQLSETTWLFKQYGKRKPDWLRQKFLIDQRRRKCLSMELVEAQLDRIFCDRYQNTDEWYDLLHLLWHNIHGEQSCK
jgi:transposase